MAGGARWRSCCAAVTIWIRRPARRRWRPRRAIRSVAVLPLQNIGGGDYFADGMTEALIADLGRTGVLDVISRTSVMRFKGSQQPLPEIAKALNVDAIVEGSVLRDGRRVRITAQLIDARTDKHLWANSYERDVRDVLALQADVARAIAQEVRTTLSRQQEARSAETSRRAVSPEALEAYLQGRFYWNRRGGDAAQVGRLLRAGDQDRSRLRGRVCRAGRQLHAARIGERLDGAEAAMARAKGGGSGAQAGRLARRGAHVAGDAAFLVRLGLGRLGEGLQARDRAQPQLSHRAPLVAIFLSAMGRHDEAMAEIDQALRLDPVSAIIRASRGWIQYHRRQSDDSIVESRKALDLDADFVRAHTYLGMNYLKKGMAEDAIASSRKRIGSPAASRLPRCRGPGVRAGRPHGGSACDPRHRDPAARAALRLAVGHRGALHLAGRQRSRDGLAGQGVRRALVQHGLPEGPPIYDPLRQDPRFIALLRRMQFP